MTAEPGAAAALRRAGPRRQRRLVVDEVPAARPHLGGHAGRPASSSGSARAAAQASARHTGPRGHHPVAGRLPRPPARLRRRAARVRRPRASDRPAGPARRRAPGRARRVALQRPDARRRAGHQPHRAAGPPRPTAQPRQPRRAARGSARLPGHASGRRLRHRLPPEPAPARLHVCRAAGLARRARRAPLRLPRHLARVRVAARGAGGGSCARGHQHRSSCTWATGRAPRRCKAAGPSTRRWG